MEDTLLIPSMVPGHPGLRGLSAVVTAAEESGTANGSAAILSPSMGDFLALVHL